MTLLMLLNCFSCLSAFDPVLNPKSDDGPLFKILMLLKLCKYFTMVLSLS